MKLNPQSKHLNLLNIKFLVLLSLAFVLLDEISKIIVQRFLAVSCNQGIAFGFAQGGKGKIASFVALLLIFLLFWKAKENKLKIGFFLVFAGGLANFADRMFWGCVRDFISISIFPSFNISDVLISLGLVLIIYAIFLTGKKHDLKEGSESNF